MSKSKINGSKEPTTTAQPKDGSGNHGHRPEQAIAPVITIRRLDELKTHPLNARIYGDEADQPLVDSIMEHGVMQPVLIDKTNRIISGHRRSNAATKAGLNSIPATVFPSDDELDIEAALIESNRQRSKTNEQKAREASCLLEVEKARARLRKTTANSNTDLPAISPGDTGDARDVVARKLRIGAKKVMESAAVVGAIDKLKADGNTEDAEKIRSELKKFTVHRAFTAAQENGWLKGAVEEKPADDENSILITDWIKFTEDQKEAALAKTGIKISFNFQESEGIEWAKWSWNPITGCKHNCDYCYARDIANRLFARGFEPAFYPNRLKAPASMKLPKEAKNDVAFKNVFSGSMADLWGRWVPRDLIQRVLDAVRSAPQWNFLFLTKFPQRLPDFDFPDNAWVGTTVDTQARVATAEKAFEKVKAHVKWLSCEPMMERLTFEKLDLFQWVVIGGASKSTQTPEFKPPREWVTHLWAQAQKAGCKIYEKPNLLERCREYPEHEIGVKQDAASVGK